MVSSHSIYDSFYHVCIALAVFVRSRAAYEALKDFNVMQLPSRATLQAYTGAFLHEAGACPESIASQVSNYHSFQESCRIENKGVPRSDGALIFDEVKVISSLMWNSWNHHIIGLAMSSDDQSSLHDVFQLFDNDHRTRQTNYILQFLWRDLTSSFDIVGHSLPAMVLSRESLLVPVSWKLLSCFRYRRLVLAT